MKSLISLLVAAAILVVAGHAADAKAGIDANINDKEFSNKFSSDYATSLLGGKPGPIVDRCAEGVRLMPEFQKTVFGKINAASYFEALLARFRFLAYGRQRHEMIDLGSRVVEVGLFTMKLIQKNTGQEHEVAGKYLDLFAKGSNGELSLVTEAWNYTDEVKFADELRFESVPAFTMALQPHVPVKDSISFELAALNRLMEVVVSQHDDKMWAQFYAEDGMFLYSHNPIYEGRKALQEFLRKHVKELPVFEKLDIRDDHIDALGDYIIEYATHIANWRNGDSSGVNTGKDLRIWRRQSDGALKLYRHIGMYD